jgi:uncharacterized protein DUF6614
MHWPWHDHVWTIKALVDGEEGGVIHYNVWFSFKPGSDREVQLSRCRACLDDFKTRGMIKGYSLLENRGKQEETTLPQLQAIIEFQDYEQFGAPFAEVRDGGIHEGLHGLMIEQVEQFKVEVFEHI